MNFIKGITKKILSTPSIFAKISSVIALLVLVILTGVGIAYALTTVIDSFDNEDLISESTNILVGSGQVEISNMTTWTCGEELVDSRDGRIYDTTVIGSQCWMKDYLNVGTMLESGTTYPADNGIIEKWCYSNLPTFCDEDGGLYKWEEAMGYSETEGTQGICPTNWHIPSHDEWTTLERSVCTSETCVEDFPYNTFTTGNLGTDEGATLMDTSGSFTQTPRPGYHEWTGAYTRYDSMAKIWTSTAGPGSSDAWYRYFYNGWTTINRSYLRVRDGYKHGFSVRCVHD